MSALLDAVQLVPETRDITRSQWKHLSRSLRIAMSATRPLRQSAIGDLLVYGHVAVQDADIRKAVDDFLKNPRPGYVVPERASNELSSAAPAQQASDAARCSAAADRRD